MQVSFQDLQLSPALVSVVHDLGYTHPSPIQSEAIPALLSGQDVIGQSQTGSGKTAAFALPILQKIDIDRHELQALVLCPTRELTSQVGREMRKLGRDHHGLQVVELVGGQPMRPQREALERGAQIVIGTPGRLMDLMERRYLKPGAIKIVVLDEADRMLDMGFGDAVREIMRFMPRRRQTALFSATFPRAIEAISQEIQREAIRITIKEEKKDLADIRQLKLCYGDGHKFTALCSALHSQPHGSALVFCNKKTTVREITEELRRGGISADRFDGDLEQFDRDQVLARFRNQSVRVLIATDVAGRGLDVEGLDLVINYDLPMQKEGYIHRIGRTGRAGANGVAVTLVEDKNDQNLSAIQAFTEQKIATLDLHAGEKLGLDELLSKLTEGPQMETIMILGGRKDKIRKGDLLGALTGDAAGLSGKDIGMIEIQDKLSYVAVSRGVVKKAVLCLNKGKVKGKRFRASQVGK